MTFSIVARDAQTGNVGVATATAGPVVGSLVPHAGAGVGAIATQSRTNPYFGFDGLELLADPQQSAQAVLDALVAGDPDREFRQCIVLDRFGGTAAWTGKGCTDVAGALPRQDVAVAGNYLSNAAVLEAMLSAFAVAGGKLEDRMIAALMAGARNGGDKRGTRSAGLKVYGREPYPLVDLRADWSEAPIDDLQRILAATRESDYADFFGRLPARHS